LKTPASEFGAAAPSDLERAVYGEGVVRVAPASAAELVEAVRDLEASGRPIVPAGRGTHAYLGNPPPEPPVVLTSERLDRVLRYEADDFTISVESGLPLARLRALTAENRQELAADWPRGAAGTVGGLVSAAIPGPRRAFLGPLRSQVIGVHGVRAGGRRYKAGGMVVKNVAGYEVAKLLCGALGTAGVLERVNFKLRPLPETRRGRIAVFADRREAWRFATALRRERLSPAVLTVLEGRSGGRFDRVISSPRALAVAWFFEGNRGLVDWLDAQVSRLRARIGAGALTESGPLEGEEAEALFDRLCGFGEPIGAPRSSEGCVRLSVLPARASEVHESVSEALEVARVGGFDVLVDACAGQLCVAWHAASQRLDEPVRELGRLAQRSGGAGWLLYLPPERRRRWPYLLVDDPNRALSEKVLRVFDPTRRYCPGRLFGLPAPVGAAVKRARR
jgi:glycolate oxidase FAD binding subunit